MTMQSSYDTEKEQIRSVADTKDIDIDKIEVSEGTNDDGDTVVQFRVYETYSDDPDERVAVPVSKMVGMEMSDVSFREEVNRKLSKLKRYLQNDQSVDDDTEQVEQETADGVDDDTKQSSRTRTRQSRPTSGDGPGAELDAEIEAIHGRLDDLEARIEALEDKSEALDGLQQLMQGNEGNDG